MSFLLHHLKWICLTFRNDLNLLINGLQLPEPPCRKWINVDFGFEGLGLQKRVFKSITRLCAFWPEGQTWCKGCRIGARPPWWNQSQVGGHCAHPDHQEDARERTLWKWTIIEVASDYLDLVLAIYNYSHHNPNLSATSVDSQASTALTFLQFWFKKKTESFWYGRCS